MANRNTLHFKHFEPFKKWLIKNSWEMKPLSMSQHEVLRATKNNEWILIYKRDEATEHYSLSDNSCRYVNKWLNEVKLRKQFAREIKEELKSSKYRNCIGDLMLTDNAVDYLLKLFVEGEFYDRSN